jgi:hypothetical protein
MQQSRSGGWQSAAIFSWHWRWFSTTLEFQRLSSESRYDVP